jgi:hypothetical protein
VCVHVRAYVCACICVYACTVEVRAVRQVDVGPVQVGPIRHAEVGGHLGKVQALTARHLCVRFDVKYGEVCTDKYLGSL